MNGNLTAGKVLALLGIVAGGVLVAGGIMASMRKSIDLIGYVHSGFDS